MKIKKLGKEDIEKLIGDFKCSMIIFDALILSENFKKKISNIDKISLIETLESMIKHLKRGLKRGNQ